MHASCVAFDGQALLICGASGSGKSSLALTLMALGADLVADDQCVISATDDGLWATAPAPLRGVIEARGVALLRARPVARGHLLAVAVLDRPETDRLPPLRHVRMLGHPLRCFHNPGTAAFPMALRQYLIAGEVPAT